MTFWKLLFGLAKVSLINFSTASCGSSFLLATSDRTVCDCGFSNARSTEAERRDCNSRVTSARAASEFARTHKVCVMEVEHTTKACDTFAGFGGGMDGRALPFDSAVLRRSGG